MDDITPSRSAFLELRDEREAMHEGQVFLDEKRTALAAEIIAQLNQYAAIRSRLQVQYTEANNALQVAVLSNGLEAVQCYPPANVEEVELRLERGGLLGVPLLQAGIQRAAEDDAENSETHKTSIQRCQARFQEVVELMVEQAAISANLRRLYQDYAKTERRVRALEDVMIPELDNTLHQLESHLEGIELEDAVRVRQPKVNL